MPKITIIGSLKNGPYDIIFVPTPHPEGQEAAQKKCFAAIDDSDEVWVVMDNIGEHTIKDMEHAIKRYKQLRLVIALKGGK